MTTVNAGNSNNNNQNQAPITLMRKVGQVINHLTGDKITDNKTFPSLIVCARSSTMHWPKFKHFKRQSSKIRRKMNMNRTRKN